MVNSTLNIIVMATFAMLLATTVRGGPLPGKNVKTFVARTIRSNCVALMEYSSTLYRDMESSRFKNGNYDHYVPLGKEMEPVMFYDNMSNQEFLKRQIILFYKLDRMVREIIAYESKQNLHDNYKGRFGDVESQIHDIFSYLHHMEKVSNLPPTKIGTALYPTATVKPQATQKEHDEWALMVLKELGFSLITLQRGMAEKYLSN